MTRLSQAARPRSWTRWAAWCVGFAIVALLRLPAAWLLAEVRLPCDGRCALTDVHGTPWHGQAQLVALDARGDAHPLLPLAWRFDVGAMTAGALAWHVGTPAVTHIALAWHGIRLAPATAHLPADAIEALAAGRTALARWGGRIDLNTEAIACTWQGDCRGRLAGTWRALRFGSLHDAALGDYAFQLQRGEGDPAWLGHARAERGPLWLDLTMNPERLQGEAWIDAPARAALGPLVAGVARYDTITERYRLNLPLRLDGGKE